MDNLTIVYRENVDLFFYVIGSANENEVCLVFFSYLLITDRLSRISFSLPSLFWFYFFFILF